jgi:16S rRNA (cytosine967-C5)-methyltransferase
VSQRTARAIAFDALIRIDEGAYANLVLPALLERSGLPDRDRHHATELVYGTTRMRRACDFVLQPFLQRDVDPEVRTVLRLGAYQLVFLGTPAHAAVSATVDVAPGRARGFVNAVLRRVSEAPAPRWPDLATELSYPDWVVERLTADLGEATAVAALRRMNVAAAPHRRPDGYVQDVASQWVADLVLAGSSDLVVDVCAAPGGKATWMAHGARHVVAGDARASRTSLIAANARRTHAGNLSVLAMDARRAPLRGGRAQRVVVDAPCSGLGVLGRRPDARWRMVPEAVDGLAQLQRQILDDSVRLVAPEGHLIYSVCTLTRTETLDIDAWLQDAHPDLRALDPPAAPWQPHGRGALLLPQSAETDGMYLVRLRRS